MENVTVIRSKWVFGDANTLHVISATGMTFSYSNVESEIVPVGFTLLELMGVFLLAVRDCIRSSQKREEDRRGRGGEE